MLKRVTLIPRPQLTGSVSKKGGYAGILEIFLLDKLDHYIFFRLDLEHLEKKAYKFGRFFVAAVAAAYAR
ncbi:hypothetical protein AYI69_g3335 [Smittium culicis]|uniref:Uncharacterized protein n=1 Tax=Smittium culicis TaxID=133412 RepID=A0A1R1YJZ1_9FUNG|nr:hypothetical protein AYI69_g3335 [Smittium culicis]